MVDQAFVDLLSAELTVCDRLMSELTERQAALRTARLQARLGVANDIVAVHLRKVCPTLLVETRCEACEAPAITCHCPV